MGLDLMVMDLLAMALQTTTATDMKDTIIMAIVTTMGTTTVTVMTKGTTMGIVMTMDMAMGTKTLVLMITDTLVMARTTPTTAMDTVL